MAKAVYNGLSKDEIIIFYKFLCQYESIKSINRDKLLNTHYPNCSYQFKKLIPRQSLIIKSAAELQTVKLTINNAFYFTNNSTKLLSFLRHLRNAIAHGNITKKNKQYIIKDYSHSQPTAIGVINAEIIISVINIFIK